MSDQPREAMKGGIEPISDGPTPTGARLPDGQYADHWVLPEEERAKGFVRPVRLSYRHMPPHPDPSHVCRSLTEGEAARYDGQDYVLFEEYPEDRAPLTGKFWTQAQLDAHCGVVTRMARPLAETYARDPTYYGATFCAGCGDYFPVAEFVWTDDGTRLGT